MSNQYEALGLSVISRSEVVGLSGEIKAYRKKSLKLKMVQLVTAIVLLVCLVSDMLPFFLVLVSGLVIIVAAVVFEKRALNDALQETASLIRGSGLDDNSFASSLLENDSPELVSLVRAGAAIVGEDRVFNVDNDHLVLCGAAEETPSDK